MQILAAETLPYKHRILFYTSYPRYMAKGRPSYLNGLAVMNVSRCLSEELANVSVPVEQPASRVGTETGLVRVQRDRVGAARSRWTV
jgi:hypothetical protein